MDRTLQTYWTSANLYSLLSPDLNLQINSQCSIVFKKLCCIKCHLYFVFEDEDIFGDFEDLETGEVQKSSTKKSDDSDESGDDESDASVPLVPEPLFEGSDN